MKESLWLGNAVCLFWKENETRYPSSLCQVLLFYFK